VGLAQGQGKRVQRLVWRLEDASVFTAKFAAKAVVKGVRPALVCELYTSRQGIVGVGQSARQFGGSVTACACAHRQQQRIMITSVCGSTSTSMTSTLLSMRNPMLTLRIPLCLPALLFALCCLLP
jgi:hypothetical protein